MSQPDSASWILSIVAVVAIAAIVIVTASGRIMPSGTPSPIPITDDSAADEAANLGGQAIAAVAAGNSVTILGHSGVINPQGIHSQDSSFARFNYTNITCPPGFSVDPRNTLYCRDPKGNFAQSWILLQVRPDQHLRISLPHESGANNAELIAYTSRDRINWRKMPDATRCYNGISSYCYPNINFEPYVLVTRLAMGRPSVVNEIKTITIPCTDTDGKSPDHKGTTRGLFVSTEWDVYQGPGERTDICYESGEGIREFYCESGEIKSMFITCANGCYDGACNPTYYRPTEEPTNPKDPNYLDQ